MTSAEAGNAQGVVALIDEFFDGVFAPLEAWRPRLTERIAEATAAGPVTGGQLLTLVETEAWSVLDSTERPIYGAGFCASEHIVAEGNPLAWWQGPDRLLLASSTFGPGQAAVDLQRLEWYRLPAGTGQPHVAGPFVDYLCSNEITVTAALPVEVDGQFAGVLCADVLVAVLERVLLPLVAGLGQGVLVNTQGRVVVSADPSYGTGDRLAGVLESDDDQLLPFGGFRSEPSARYPFAVLIPN